MHTSCSTGQMIADLMDLYDELVHKRKQPVNLMFEGFSPTFCAVVEHCCLSEQVDVWPTGVKLALKRYRCSTSSRGCNADLHDLASVAIMDEQFTRARRRCRLAHLKAWRKNRSGTKNRDWTPFCGNTRCLCCSDTSGRIARDVALLRALKTTVMPLHDLQRT
jgi:hypothetical protein